MTSTRKIALVTGASRQQGIGAAICRALANDGVDIFFTHWGAYDKTMSWGDDPHLPNTLCAELRAIGVTCEHLEADLSQPETPENILKTLEEKMAGSATILVNNAAYSTSEGYDTLTAHSLDAHYAVNMRGAMLLSAAFVKHFKGNRGGRIINLTSGQSLGPMPSELAYIATKGAIEAFIVSLAAGVSSLGITVNAVDPGPTDTGWISPGFYQEVLARFPQGRIGKPEDAARLIAFLASDAAEWITGQVIHSDGGFIRG